MAYSDWRQNNLSAIQQQQALNVLTAFTKFPDKFKPNQQISPNVAVKCMKLLHKTRDKHKETKCITISEVFDLHREASDIIVADLIQQSNPSDESGGGRASSCLSKKSESRASSSRTRVKGKFRGRSTSSSLTMEDDDDEDSEPSTVNETDYMSDSEKDELSENSDNEEANEMFNEIFGGLTNSSKSPQQTNASSKKVGEKMGKGFGQMMGGLMEGLMGPLLSTTFKAAQPYIEEIIRILKELKNDPNHPPHKRELYIKAYIMYQEMLDIYKREDLEGMQIPIKINQIESKYNKKAIDDQLKLDPKLKGIFTTMLSSADMNSALLQQQAQQQMQQSGLAGGAQNRTQSGSSNTTNLQNAQVNDAIENLTEKMTEECIIC